MSGLWPQSNDHQINNGIIFPLYLLFLALFTRITNSLWDLYGLLEGRLNSFLLLSVIYQLVKQIILNTDSLAKNIFTFSSVNTGRCLTVETKPEKKDSYQFLQLAEEHLPSPWREAAYGWHLITQMFKCQGADRGQVYLRFKVCSTKICMYSIHAHFFSKLS